MSIAEKLTTIAENQQRVYNAGYTAGQAAGGGGADPTPTQEKTVNIIKNGTVEVTPDEGCALSKVTANVNVPNVLNYISSNWEKDFVYMFYQAVFPYGCEIMLDILNAPTNINSMFRKATGFSKLSFIVPTKNKVYEADRFLNYSSSDTPTVEELVLPEGIKFSKFEAFATYARTLRTITGAIDLSESTSNSNCFMSCAVLVDVRFVENTIKSSVYIKQSANLSAGTIDSLVKGLAPVDTRQDLSLHSTVINKLTPEQITAIANKNWQAI